MKHLKNYILIALTLILMISCAGCGEGKDEPIEPVNIAFVVGLAGGETRIKDGIEELSMIPAMPGTDFAFISIDGTPSCIGEPGKIADVSDRGYTSQMMERVKAGIKADLADRIASFEPDSAEIDMAGAIQLGVRQLNAKTDGRKNILVLYCSGKSTTGLINMAETPIYKLDLEASVPTIAEKMNLDMSQLDEVVWYCCGELGGNGQPALSSTEQAKLKEFYEELFITLGMDKSKITFKDDLPSTEFYQFDETPVSCMDVEGTVSGLKELIELEPEVFEAADNTVLEDPIVIPESKVCYKPDSADFLYPDVAAEAIQPVADFLLEYTDLKLLIYGTCAGDSDSDYTLELGRARAQSVKNVLVGAGVEASRITAVTVRVANDPYHQYGLGTGDEASVNRKTIMVDMSSDLAQQIMAHAQ